jgi:hypothetical protein
MRKKPRIARHYKQIYNPSPRIRTRRRSAVFACPSPLDDEDTSKKFQFFEGWPEIVQHNRFYVLPTVGAMYYPKPSHTFIKTFIGPNNQINDLMDNYINIFPFLEPYKAQLFPKIREIYQLLYGTELPETFNKALAHSQYVVLRIFLHWFMI